MGLAERRRIAAIKDSAPQYQKELNDALGFEMPFELDSTTFPEDIKVLECWDWYVGSNGPSMIATVMKGICADSLGRDAVKAKFDKIVFKNGARSADEHTDKSLQIDGRTLVITSSFYGYADRLWDSSGLQKALEDML